MLNLSENNEINKEKISEKEGEEKKNYFSPHKMLKLTDVCRKKLFGCIIHASLAEMIDFCCVKNLSAHRKTQAVFLRDNICIKTKIRLCGLKYSKS